MKKKICDYCKKKYKREAQMFNLFGGEFCLHDDKLTEFRKLNGMSVKNNPEIKVTKALWGHNKSERRYIENSEKRGNTVVRGSDGLLREIGKSKK